MCTDAQLIGMSATLGNGEQVARWLDAAYYESTYRPIELRQWIVVCDGHTGSMDNTLSIHAVLYPHSAWNSHPLGTPISVP